MLALALLTAPVSKADESCTDPEATRKWFAYHPWPEVDFGDGASRLTLPRDGIREPRLLEYFVSSVGRVP